MRAVTVRSYRRPGRLMPRSERGLRACSVCLRPGQVMPWHSTGAREEVVLVLDGQLRLELRRASGRLARRVVREGSSVYLPPRTPHQLVNASRRSARYVYVTGAV